MGMIRFHFVDSVVLKTAGPGRRVASAMKYLGNRLAAGAEINSQVPKHPIIPRDINSTSKR